MIMETPDTTINGWMVRHAQDNYTNFPCSPVLVRVQLLKTISQVDNL